MLLLPNVMAVFDQIFTQGSGQYFVMFTWCVCLPEEHKVIFSLGIDIGKVQIREEAVSLITNKVGGMVCVC